MTTDPLTPESAREDLAFMRALVAPSDSFQRQFGQAYFAAGLCYGVQMLLHGAQGFGLFPGMAAGLTIGFGPTVVFLAILFWQRGRSAGAAPSVANRAISGVFSAIGLANLALAAIIALGAWRAQSLQVWLLFPCVVMVLQGAAWLVVWHIRRRGWFGLVAAGWFVIGLAMGVAIVQPPIFMILAGLGFLLFMLIPGWAMMRQPKAA